MTYPLKVYLCLKVLLRGGAKYMKQEHVHQYVLEHVAGLPVQLKRANRVAGITASLSFILAIVVLVLTIFGSGNFELNLQLALAMLVAGFPFGILAQRFTARAVLHRHNLKITKFIIGKKEYLVPDHGKLNHEMDIFGAACSLVGTSEALETAKHAAAWHTYQVSDEVPGVAICLGWFGPSGKPYAFIYGDPNYISSHAQEVWDLGHIRQKHQTDINLFQDTAKLWRKHSNLPVAIAFAPLSQDAEQIDFHLSDIQGQITLLGLIQLQGSRESNNTFTPQLSTVMQFATNLHLKVSLALLALLSLSFVSNIIWSMAPVISLVPTLIISVLFIPLLLSSTSWDKAKHQALGSFSKQLFDAIIVASMIAIAGLGQFYILLSRNEIALLSLKNNSIIHSAALAAVLLTVSGCILIELLLARGRSYNPFFMLASASALLLMILAAYITGPLLAIDLWFIGGIIILFWIVRSLQKYASNHHTREHIIELLSQR